MVRDFIQAGEAVPRGGIPMPSGAGRASIERPGPPERRLTFPRGLDDAAGRGAGRRRSGPTVLGVTTDIVDAALRGPDAQR